MTISRRAETAIESILVAYCTLLPYHAGKGRIINAIIRFVPSLGKGQRHAVRHGIMWELGLECLIQRGIYYDSYEPWETRYLRKTVKTGWSVIDVGANTGYYSLLLGQLVGPKGLVHAFEPQLDLFDQLCRHISMNKMDWIKPHQCALGDTIEHRHMTALLRCNSGVQRIATNKDKGINQVQVTTLDEFVEQTQLSSIDLVKVDIEGFEYKFLNGAKRTLKKFSPLLLMELNCDSLIAYETSVTHVLDLLKEGGYVIHQFERKQLRVLKKLPRAG